MNILRLPKRKKKYRKKSKRNNSLSNVRLEEEKKYLAKQSIIQVK